MLGKSKSFIIIGATAAQPHLFFIMPWNKLRWNYTDTSHLLEKREEGRNKRRPWLWKGQCMTQKGLFLQYAMLRK